MSIVPRGALQLFRQCLGWESIPSCAGDGKEIGDSGDHFLNVIILRKRCNGIHKIFFLPAYSPNLNTTERSWRLMQKEIIDSTYYATHAKSIVTH